MGKITWANKVTGDPGDDGKFLSDNANVIKNSVNALYDRVRVGANEVATGDIQTVTFKFEGTNSPLASSNYAIFITDFQQLGWELISKSNTGFSIRFLSGGLFDYKAELTT
jgi:hypothetical protein